MKEICDNYEYVLLEMDRLHNQAKSDDVFEEKLYKYLIGNGSRIIELHREAGHTQKDLNKDLLDLATIYFDAYKLGVFK
ncbi:hypothetical protein [Selenomonas ruminantium]|uniref:Uncharacterized protein n=1 Tax=Selenomonas ruminantium TaxID=971 RepID=A0A1I0W2I3_SELRU|nr:hypothetical protein [Selenomonas ruminantium]SFA82557.1 hypothetical protein SAMN05216587_10252 [Selenomonas ruminantium]